MDEVMIAIRTRTDRPGKDPICTSEFISLDSLALDRLRHGDERDLCGAVDRLMSRARACVALDKSASEFTIADAAEYVAWGESDV